MVSLPRNALTICRSETLVIRKKPRWGSGECRNGAFSAQGAGRAEKRFAAKAFPCQREKRCRADLRPPPKAHSRLRQGESGQKTERSGPRQAPYSQVPAKQKAPCCPPPEQTARRAHDSRTPRECGNQPLISVNGRHESQQRGRCAERRTAQGNGEKSNSKGSFWGARPIDGKAKTPSAMPREKTGISRSAVCVSRSAVP